MSSSWPAASVGDRLEGDLLEPVGEVRHARARGSARPACRAPAATLMTTITGARSVSSSRSSSIWHVATSASWRPSIATTTGALPREPQRPVAERRPGPRRQIVGVAVAEDVAVVGIRLDPEQVADVHERVVGVVVVQRGQALPAAASAPRSRARCGRSRAMPGSSRRTAGRARPPRTTRQSPSSQVTRRGPRFSRSSPSRRDLPIPASPISSSDWPRPASRSSAAMRSRAASTSLPTSGDCVWSTPVVLRRRTRQAETGAARPLSVSSPIGSSTNRGISRCAVLSPVDDRAGSGRRLEPSRDVRHVAERDRPGAGPPPPCRPPRARR